MKKNFESLYETLGGTYREENGHLIPDITLPEQTDYQIGKYGRMYLDYIKQHRRGRYTTLLSEGKLNARLHEIDLEANEMLEIIIPRLATRSEERRVPSATVLLDIVKVHTSILADLIVGLFGKGYVRNEASIFLAVGSSEVFIKAIKLLFHCSILQN